jgi:Flp pilus assembly protein TadB
MTARIVAVAVSLLVVGALAALRRAMFPRSRSIEQIRAALRGVDPSQRDTRRGETGRTGRLESQAASMLAPSVERRLGDDLRIIDRTAGEVAARIVVAFLGGVGFLVVLLGGLVAAGLLPATPFWLIVPLLAGAAAAWIMWSDTVATVARRRAEFGRAANDFVQLVAVGLTTDQSVEAAISFAGQVGDGPAFAVIRDQLAAAPLRGLTVWDALDELADRYDHRELHEVASSVQRQGTQGVSISETISSLAQSMRAKALDDLERAADKANANLAGPTVAFVVTTVVFLAYPLAIRISAAFGG